MVVGGMGIQRMFNNLQALLFFNFRQVSKAMTWAERVRRHGGQTEIRDQWPGHDVSSYLRNDYTKEHGMEGRKVEIQI